MKSLLATLFVFSSAVALAQPIVNQAYHPIVGNHWSLCHMVSFGGFTPPDSGINRVWDYTSWVRCLSVGALETKPASVGAHSSQFPESNILMQAGNGPEQYYQAGESGFRYNGFIGSTSADVDFYNPLLLLIPMPLQFGESFLDTAICTTTDEWHIVSGRYMGSGTLLIPGHSYSNVVMFHFWRTHQSASPPHTVTRQIECYYGYTPGVGYPVFLHRQEGIRVTSDYIRNALMANKPALPTGGLSVSPQPASAAVSFALPEGEAYPLRASLLDASGRTVRQTTVSEGTVPLLALPPGLYTLEIQGRRRTYRTRLVKQ